MTETVENYLSAIPRAVAGVAVYHAVAADPQSAFLNPHFILPRCDQCHAPYRGNPITITFRRETFRLCCVKCVDDFRAGMDLKRMAEDLEDRMLRGGRRR